MMLSALSRLPHLSKNLSRLTSRARPLAGRRARSSMHQAVLETLEPRVLLDAMVHYYAKSSDAPALFQTAVVAEGRVGGPSTFEGDVGPSTAAPAQTFELSNTSPWVKGQAKNFALTVDSAGLSSFTLGGVTKTYTTALTRDDLLIRAFAHPTTTGGEMKLVFNSFTVGGQEVVDGQGIALVGGMGLWSKSGGGSDQSVWVTGANIGQGFTLTGQATMNWTTTSAPTQSRLSFQLAAGRYDTSVDVVAEDGVASELRAGAVKPATFRIDRSGYTAGSMTVNLALGGTAGFDTSAGADDYFLALDAAGTQALAIDNSGLATVTIGANENYVRVYAVPHRDALVEPDETITLTAVKTSRGTIGHGNASAVLYDVPTVSVVASTPYVVEGQTAQFTLTREGDPDGEITATFEVSGTATEDAAPPETTLNDYSYLGRSVTFTGNGTQALTLTARADASVEGVETVLVTPLVSEYVDSYQVTGQIATVHVIDPLAINLTAHRTGDFFGEVVEESDEGNSRNFVVLTNNDAEISGELGLLDFEVLDKSTVITTQGAVLDPDTQRPIDDDLVKITLQKLPASWLAFGSIRLEVSEPTTVRLYTNSGVLLNERSIDLSSTETQQNALSGLRENDLDIWAEFLSPNASIIISLQYWAPGAQSATLSDSIAINSVEWAFVSPLGQTVATQSVDAQKLIDLASGDPGTPLPDVAKYRVQLAGLVSESNATIEYISDEYPQDSFTTNYSSSIDESWTVLYHTDSVDELLNRSAIRDSLNVNVLHNQTATQKVHTPKDRQVRKIAGTAAFIAQNDPFIAVNEDPNQASAQRLIYDMDKPLSLLLNVLDQTVKAIENKGVTGISWDLDGDGTFGNIAAEKNAEGEANFGTRDRVTVSYTTAEVAANDRSKVHVNTDRRLIVQPAFRFVKNGSPIDANVYFLRLYLALPQKQVAVGADRLPVNGQNQVTITNDWLAANYPDFANGVVLPAGLTFSNIADMGYEASVIDKITNNSSATLNAQRLIVGGTTTNMGGSEAVTARIPGNLAEGKFPDAKVAGTILASDSTIFAYDKFELNWAIEHERNQIRSVKALKDGTSMESKVRAAAVAKNMDAATVEQLTLAWNQFERTKEDLISALKGEGTGNVSWNFLQSRLTGMWDAYARIATQDNTIVGSLGWLKAQLPDIHAIALEAARAFRRDLRSTVTMINGKEIALADDWVYYSSAAAKRTQYGIQRYEFTYPKD